MTETPTKVVCIKVLRYLWATPASSSLAHAQWPDAAVHDIFGSSNGSSLRDYWYPDHARSSRPQVDVEPWHVLRQAQVGLADDRSGMIDAARKQAAEDGVSLDGYDHLIVFVHAPPCNAGATGRFGDAVFDQNPFSLGFHQHEVGHVLGFEHAFGPAGPHDDRYCVMGFSLVQNHGTSVRFIPGLVRAPRRRSVQERATQGLAKMR